MAVSPDGKSAYVTNLVSDTVWVVDTATNKATEQITGFDAPFGVSITPDGKYAYVTNSGDSTVSVIVTATNTNYPPLITVGNRPEGVAFSPDSAVGYVTNTGDGTVTVIAGLPVLPPSTTAPAPSLSKAIAATL